MACGSKDLGCGSANSAAGAGDDNEGLAHEGEGGEAKKNAGPCGPAFSRGEDCRGLPTLAAAVGSLGCGAKLR